MRAIFTLVASLALVACNDGTPYHIHNADTLEIVNKAEYENGKKILYMVRSYSDENFKNDWNSDWESHSTTFYLYSTDRSLDVGDKIQIIKK